MEGSDKGKQSSIGFDWQLREKFRDKEIFHRSNYGNITLFVELFSKVSIFSYSCYYSSWNVQLLLQVLKDATKFFSSNSPNILAIIPAMDAIDEQFATGIVEGHEMSAPLKHALAIGKRTLNKYYALTDASDIYRMAMGMYIILF